MQVLGSYVASSPPSYKNVPKNSMFQKCPSQCWLKIFSDFLLKVDSKSFHRFCEHEKPTSYYPAYSFQRMKVFLDFWLIHLFASFAILVLFYLFHVTMFIILCQVWLHFLGQLVEPLARLRLIFIFPGLVFGRSGQQVPQQWSHLQNQMCRSSLEASKERMRQTISWYLRYYCR